MTDGTEGHLLFVPEFPLFSPLKGNHYHIHPHPREARSLVTSSPYQNGTSVTFDGTKLTRPHP